MENNENIQFDCNRGCMVTRDANDELNCTYRRGCCKLEDYNWLKGISQGQYSDCYEVRFKNTRKGFYVNSSGQSIKMGDLVIVESQSGHDLGIVTLEGPIVGKQMKCRGIDPENTEFKKIYRKAKSLDIEKWQEAISREQETMIRSRQIAVELGLDMKIGDVEFQGDGTKAIFYYIADGRVDFRQLIKVFAEEFRIRIEMKQIGARQEAGRIGGTGPCGRELCCATWMKNFVSVSTGAARYQDISLNPQKLAGMCAKLKCCLNYEVDNYIEASRKLPSREVVLQTIDGDYYLFKTDILAGLVTYSTDKRLAANLETISGQRALEIIEMNKRGEKPESLTEGDIPKGDSKQTDLLAGESLTRFDKAKKKKKGNKPRGQKPQQEKQAKGNEANNPAKQKGDRQKPKAEGQKPKADSPKERNDGQKERNDGQKPRQPRQQQRGNNGNAPKDAQQGQKGNAPRRRPGRDNQGRQQNRQQDGQKRSDNKEA